MPFNLPQVEQLFSPIDDDGIEPRHRATVCGCRSSSAKLELTDEAQ
jgi:hypothetical protein